MPLWQTEPVDIPARLRARRRTAGLTLKDAARAAALSVSTLSRIETGERGITLETAMKLASLYDISLDELVSDPAAARPNEVRRGSRTFTPVGRTPRSRRAQRVTVQAADTVPVPRAHPGREWLYVLSGQLRLVLGEQDVILPAGGSVEFDTRIPHWFGSSGQGRVEVLCLLDVEGNPVTTHDHGLAAG